MHKQSDDGPISPMKKLKILSEQQTNVQKTKEFSLESIKENVVIAPSAATPNAVPKEEDEVKANLEPLLQETPGQYVIFPINYHDMWHMYKRFVDSFWSVTETLEEIDRLNLNYEEKQFMKYFSSIFASPESQDLVINTFGEDLCKIIQVTEAKFFYGHQLFVQNIHYEMYNKLLEKFIPTKEEREKLFKIVENFDAVSSKRKWIAKWHNAQLSDKILVSACIHGLFFISLDLVFDWLKNKTRGSFSHELIEIVEKMMADRELERDFACLMLSNLKAKPSKETILRIINETAKLEFDFILNGLQIDLIKTDTDDIIQLIDKKTKDLKAKIFNSFDEKKKLVASNETTNAKKEANVVNNENESRVFKENHQKIVFDEDF